MNKNNTETDSSYQQHLPAIIQEQKFVGKFLQAFEKILSGDGSTTSPEIIRAKDQNPPGLEEIINIINLYFVPFEYPKNKNKASSTFEEPQKKEETPEEFLHWLAGWVALSLQEDWKPEFTRDLIANFFGDYRMRGTLKGLQNTMDIFNKYYGFKERVVVEDQTQRPYTFKVQFTLNEGNRKEMERQERIAKTIINGEKPAYTTAIIERVQELTLQEWLVNATSLRMTMTGLLYTTKLISEPKHLAFLIAENLYIRKSEPRNSAITSGYYIGTINQPLMPPFRTKWPGCQLTILDGKTKVAKNTIEPVMLSLSPLVQLEEVKNPVDIKGGDIIELCVLGINKYQIVRSEDRDTENQQIRLP